MKGHQALIQMRMRGLVPASVFLDVDADAERIHSWVWRDWTTPAHPWAPLHAHVVVESKDAIPRLDLRCVIGLPAFVVGKGERALRVRDACIRAGAKRVVCFADERLTVWEKEEANGADAA